MKFALSIVLVAALVNAAIPAAAAEPGPIARAMEREAARVASQMRSQPERSTGSTRVMKDTILGAGIGTGAAVLLGAGTCPTCGVGPDTAVFAVGGAGVGALVGAVVGALGGRNPRSVFTGLKRDDVTPGTGLLVSTRGAPAVTRYFVNAGDADIVVLNTSLSTIPSAAARTLHEIAAKHPEALVAAEAGASRTFDNVRLGRDGVFLSDRKIADMAQILERISRADLEAGRSTTVIPGSKGKSLAARIAIGTGVGFGASVFTGAALCIGRCGG